MSRVNDERKYQKRSSSNWADQSSGSPRANWFFPFTPNKEQKDAINAATTEDLLRFQGLLQKAVELGYRIGIKWNVSRNAVQASCTGGEDSDYNAGKCVAAYHIDYNKAVLVLAYSLSSVFPLQSEWNRIQAGFDDNF